MGRYEGAPDLKARVSSMRPREGEVCDCVVTASVRRKKPVLNLWHCDVRVEKRTQPPTNVRLPTGGMSVVLSTPLAFLLGLYRGKVVNLPARIGVVNGHTLVVLYRPPLRRNTN